MNELLVTALTDRALAGVVEVTEAHGELVVRVLPAALVEVCTTLRDDPSFAFDFLMDVTAVDYPGREPRFEVVYHLYSLAVNHRVRLKVGVPEANPHLPSVTPVWRGANWLERETYDMYGIQFDGHPDLRRIYLYEEFEGHPLRKDYPKEKRQPLVTRADVEPAQQRRQRERDSERYGRW